jgi:predicted nucleic acid-binding protein
LILDASSLYIILKRGDLKALGNAETLDLAFYEIGNSMLKELRRKLIIPESFAKALSVLALMTETISVRRFGELDARRVSDVAKSTGLTFYDASYLTLATILNDTLVTNDRELSEEARKLGVRAISV